MRHPWIRLAALTAVLVTALAASAHTLVPEPPARSFEQRVALGGDLAARVEPGKLFDLAGLRWRGAAHAHVRVRARVDGEWSPWAPLGTGHADTETATDPVWAGQADALEVQSDRPLPGLVAAFENTTGTATERDRAATAARRAAGVAGAALAGLLGAEAGAAPAAPAIRPRSDWDDGSCTPREAPEHGTVRMAVVHHTVSLNDYGPEESPSIVLAMCRYHRNQNGWNDLGYNLVADRHGQVFEGRAGGVDKPVVGAHAQGWNSQSTGVSVIGTYSDTPLPEPGLGALGQVLGWKLALHGVAADGQATLVSQGGSENRYAKGTPVTFNTISGHRDGDRTECPGASLYAQLPELRRRAAGHGYPLAGAGARPELDTGRGAIAYRGRLRLTGQAAAGPGSEVRLQADGRDGWRTIERVEAGPDGRFEDSFRVGSTHEYRALGPSGASPVRRVQVRPRVATLVRGARRPGGRLVVHARVRPMKRRLVFRLERLSGERWRTVSREVARTRRGRARARLALRGAGDYRVRVLSYGDSRHASGRSHAKRVVVE